MDKFHGSHTAVDLCTDQGQPWLPPGFRFHPTDEELVTYYLAKKIENSRFTDRAITEADLNKSEPWELPETAQMGEKEWYFYSLKDRKYPTGMRTNRATESGYWKATGKDREVMSSAHGGGIRLVGMKKTLVFYMGRAPKGVKTNWVMHEYRAEAGLLAKSGACRGLGKDEWVVCRVFHKSAGGKKMSLTELSRPHTHVSSTSSLPPLMESPIPSGRATSPLHAPLTPEIRQNSTSASACSAANYQLQGPPDGPVSGTAVSAAAAAASNNAFRTFLDQYNSATKPRAAPAFDHLLAAAVATTVKPEPYVACQLGDVQLAGACQLAPLQASASGQQLDGALYQAADVAAGGCVGSTAADMGGCFNIDYLQAPVVTAAGLSSSSSSSLSYDMVGQYLPRFPSDLETLMGCLNASTANGLQARFL